MGAKGEAGRAGTRSGVPAAARVSARLTIRRASSILSLLEEDGLEPSVPVDKPWFLSRKMLNLSKCLSARYPTVRRSGDVSLRAFRKRGARLGSSVSLWVTPHAWCRAARDQPWIEYGFYCDPVQSDPQRLLLICSAHFTSPHGRTS